MAKEPKQSKKSKPTKHSNAKEKKKVAIALQGGGSHGAFTWGVMDALLEDDRIEIEGVSGTSAGGMNATAIIQGLLKNGNKGAREMLKIYWTKLGEMGKKSPLQFNANEKKVNHYDLSSNPTFQLMNLMGTFLSPYQTNPHNKHPMRPLVDEIFDFPLLQKAKDHKLFLCATHIASGKLKIFTGKEITPDTLLASACVPSLFQAIEVDGDFYWDGGFIGNPAIYPLIYNCKTPDVIVIQIRRVHDPIVPRTVHDINNRLGEITQNACLTREMRAIAFISQLIDDGIIPPGKIKKLNMHLIRDDAFFGSLDRATGFSSDPDFLAYLFGQGRKCGKKWIEQHFEGVGNRTTADLAEDFVN
jgi:NTE family protein